MAETESVAGYYDGFTKRQLKTGINLRHYSIFKKAKEAGLKKNHRVLEVGCGIGTFTQLLAKYVKKGSVLATDISPKSIEIAAEYAQASNAKFVVTDMTDFDASEKFDFIVLPDVLEHIPIEQHDQLFGIFQRHSHADTIILIHIPHPLQINLLRRVQPEIMQIIDQEIHSDVLLKNAYNNGFYLHSIESYSLYQEFTDSQFIVLLPKRTEGKLRPLGKWNTSIRKMKLRIQWMLAKTF